MTFFSLNSNLQKIFNWENGDPVSFQPWKNTNDHKIKSNQNYKMSFPNQCLISKSKAAERWYSKERLLKFCPWIRKGVYKHALNSYKYAIQKHMQAQIKSKCAMMLLTNLAEPEWVSVNCAQRIIGDIMCIIPHNNNSTTNISVKRDLVVFKHQCVPISGKCYFFSWGFLNDISVIRKRKLEISKSVLGDMEHLIRVTNTEFPPFHSFSNLITYCKISRKWVSQNITEPQKGLHIVIHSGSEYRQHGNVFDCGQSIFIAYVYICDGKKDCPGDTAFDEMECICETSLVLLRKCKHFVSKERIKRCSLLYLTLKNGTCLLYGLVKVNSSLATTNHQFICKSKNVNTLVVENGLMTDCSHNMDFENQKFIEYDNFVCQENGQLPCKAGYKECYSIKDICIYRLNKNDLLIPCRTGEHVANCRLIQCNMKFKCPGFYCIPWSYACDGKWDCPGGYDETKKLECGMNRNCSYMFKCTNSQKCIHAGDVCDGLIDCPMGDDESMCSLAGSPCLSSCVCIGLAIMCYNVSSTDYQKSVPPFNAIFLSYCDLNFLHLFLKHLKFPTFISLRNNNLMSVCKMLPDLSKTLTLNVSFNLVEFVDPDCFRNGFKLISINLNNNKISIFQTVVIFQLKHLYFLDLSNNLISILFSDYYLFILYLDVVSIEKNRLSSISSRFFDNLNIKTLVTDNYFICCKTPSVSMCTSVKHWSETCKHLLLQRAITVSALCYSLFLIFANAFTVFFHKLSLVMHKQNQGSFQCVAISVNLIDLTWGIYLLIIVISDFVFADNFVIHETLWKSSFLCHLLFCINLNFNILSPLLNSFMSFSRFMVVIYPLNSKFKNRKFVLKCCILTKVIAIAIVTGFITTFRYAYSDIPFRLCSPFIDPTHSNRMLRFATYGVVYLQFIAYFSNILFHSAIISKLNNSISQKRNFSFLSTQLSILTISNTVCWIPSGIIFLICIFTDEFSIIMITWVVISITSVQPATSSILFIVITSRRQKNIFN